MSFLRARHRSVRSAKLLLLLTGVLAQGTHARSQQIAAEESRFEAARAQTEPKARVGALQQFVEQFPSGSRRPAAQELLLATYLANFPTQADQIHALASAQVMAAPAGFDRWTEEARMASLLANAGDTGVDLADAQVWAEDAVASLTEENYRREMTAAQIRYKLPRVPQKQLHAQFVEFRASFLAALATVDLRQKKPDPAAPLLQEASRLDPLSGDVNALNGQLALAQGNPSSALQSFERADAIGRLPPPWRMREVSLFQELEHGDETALDRQIDQVYRGLYPPFFTLPRRRLPPGGHTVLLELFTGSGCLPCAAPDLAIDSLLGSYSRQDLVVLAYDEHIPRPDPLTAPDAIARAASYNVTSTPQAFLDGQPLDVLGASRADVENVILGFGEPIEDQAALRSGLKLDLAVDGDGDNLIQVRPALTLTPVPPQQAAITTGDVSLRKLAQAVLYVALVQDNIRYSGENGVRFHRMVVRSIFEAPAAAFLDTTGHAAPVQFHSAILDAEQTAYLHAYENTNDRFGSFHFATTHIPIQGGDLAVVAWVQDPLSKHVLQAAFAAVPSP